MGKIVCFGCFVDILFGASYLSFYLLSIDHKL